MERTGSGEDEINSWEIIPEPYQHIDDDPPLLPRQSSLSEGINLVREDHFYTITNRSQFPPKFHHFYHHHHQESDQPHADEFPPQLRNSSSSSSSSSASSSSSDDDDNGGDSSQQGQPDSNKKVMAHMVNKLRTLIALTTSNLYSNLKFGDKFWSFSSFLLKASLVSTTVLSLVYARLIWQHNRALQQTRNRLMVLLTEKDRKISQLLMRITQLNEIVLARRRIPVVYSTV